MLSQHLDFLVCHTWGKRRSSEESVILARSVSAPDLFIAGAASHGRDRYRYKASGG